MNSLKGFGIRGEGDIGEINSDIYFVLFQFEVDDPSDLAQIFTEHVLS